MTYNSGYIHNRESKSDSYVKASTNWQKTQLLGQNSSFLLNRSVSINMLLPCSNYCLGACVAAKNQEQGIRRKEKFTKALILSMQHTVF